jgi:putative hemolysin
MSEMALVAAKKVRLQQMAQTGAPGATSAVELAGNPGRFFATIQVGITTIGIFSGAYGEAALVSKLEPTIASVAVLAPFAQEIALGLVVIAITYASLILGELVPKRLALLWPEAITVRFARPMTRLAWIAQPIVHFLNMSTEGVLRVFGARRSEEPPVTAEEIQELMRQGMDAGVFEPEEHALVSRILRLDDRRLPAIMTPRLDMTILDLEDALEENLGRVSQARFSRYPLCRGGLQEVVGIVEASSLLDAYLHGRSVDLAGLARPALFVPETITIMDLMAEFRRNRAEIALIIDEFGEVEGLVTLADVLKALVGDLPANEEHGDLDITLREDGSWLIDGSVAIDRMREVLDLGPETAEEEDGGYHTVAGLVLTQLGRLPDIAESFTWKDLRFEVVDMDGRRIDKVLVSRVAQDGGSVQAPSAGEGGSQ